MAKPPVISSWSGAAGRAAAVRDGILFAVAGVVPAILAVALGLRAVRNEEAAVRREAAAETEGSVRRAESSIVSQIRESEARLAALGPAQLVGGPPAWRRTVQAVAPPWAEVAVVDARMEPVVDESATRAPELPRRDGPCRQRATSVRRAETGVRSGLEGCETARTDMGGWLVPFTLLGMLRERDSDEAAEFLIEWLGAHGTRMARAEIVATREEIAQSRMSDAQKGRASAALDRDASSTSAAVSALRTPVAHEALLEGPDGRGILQWRGGGTLGILRVAPEGGAAGFVVDAAALGRAVAGRLADEATTKLRIVTTEPAASDAPRAVAWIAPGLGLEATLRGAGDLAARTKRSRWSLWAIAFGSGSVALVFALILFSRLRSARRTSELRTSFAAAVSHELRTPIASIRMLAELLEGDRAGDEEERRETVSAIARESRRLGETVARLLAWSRMSAGQTAPNRRIVALAEIVGDAIDVFEERNPGRKIERDLDLKLSIAIDAPLVQLAVMNLLENAKKYAPRGDPYRVVVARVEGGARIEVRDQGPGVPKAWRSRIFEAFERGDDRLSRATEGTGIGLALVRAVARAHDGDAMLDDAEKGAAFVIELRDGPATSPPEGSDEA